MKFRAKYMSPDGRRTWQEIIDARSWSAADRKAIRSAGADWYVVSTDEVSEEEEEAAAVH